MFEVEVTYIDGKGKESLYKEESSKKIPEIVTDIYSRLDGLKIIGVDIQKLKNFHNHFEGRIVKTVDLSKEYQEELQNNNPHAEIVLAEMNRRAIEAVFSMNNGNPFTEH